MISIERILCPTDFSKYAFRAADYAVALARHYDAEVHFLHVIPSNLVHPEQYPYVAEAIPVAPEFRKRALERLDAFVALSRVEGVRTRFTVSEGAPVAVILETAESEGSQILCLGTHGREGVERLVLGSVAEKVLRKARCPVLTVSEPGDERAPKEAVFQTILCAMDFGTQSLKALEHSFSLAQEAGGRLILFHAVEWFPDEPLWVGGPDVSGYKTEMEAQVRARLEQIVPKEVRDWCEVEIVVRSGRAYRELLALTRERPIDLIAMGVRGRNPLDIMLFGSTAQHVVRHATCPVLTISEGS
ncbi:MAG TPA: universal stress protein [Vicinamibacteria bacterium]|jgi:nucleotide-binding universal stress UspA family protein